MMLSILINLIPGFEILGFKNYLILKKTILNKFLIIHGPSFTPMFKKFWTKLLIIKALYFFQILFTW